jgi:Asp-tRNA(Asn)/Glu-tRNA(Gln) amidotransferase C subunit
VALRLRWRQDRVTDGGIQAEVLAQCAGCCEGEYFGVPKVVE